MGSRELQALFAPIYTNQVWNNGNDDVPRSGDGSLVKNTVRLRAFLDDMFKTGKIASIVDLGCGDLSWMPLTDIFRRGYYTGVDIVPSVIEENQKRYGSAKKHFKQVNIVTDALYLPPADLYLIRDVIFHLTRQEILSLFGSLCQNKPVKFSYLVVTSCRNNSNDVGKDIFDQWMFHPINLRKTPFVLGKPDFKIPEDEFDRDVLVYNMRSHPSLFTTSLHFLNLGLIPDRINQIWVGSNPLPAEYRRYIDSWRRNHPTWEYKLWTDEDIASGRIILRNRRIYDQAKNMAQKADILRLEILLEGGWYVDCDFESLRPLSSISSGYSFVCGKETERESNGETKDLICTALMGACPNHPIISELVAYAETSFYKHQDLCITAQTGPLFVTPFIFKYAAVPSTLICDREVFYPYLWTEERPESYPPTSVAVHHWARKW